jgi:membrane protein
MPVPTVASKMKTRHRHRERARQVLQDALLDFLHEDSLTVSASIAYYSILSLFPLMLLFVAMSGVYIGQHELSGQLAVVLGRYLPMKPDFIMINLAAISHSYGRVSVISFLLLLWSSSGMFLPLERAMNRAWDVQNRRSWWRCRLVALEMALVLGVLLFISSGLVAMNLFVHDWVQATVFPSMAFPGELFYHVLATLATFGLTLTMFVILFQRLPNRPLELRQVFPSALLTALFWEGARSLFTLLLPVFNYRHVYGSIGVVVALMTWAYASSAVTLFGAQVSNALYGSLKEEGEGAPAEVAPPLPSSAEAR